VKKSKRSKVFTELFQVIFFIQVFCAWLLLPVVGLAQDEVMLPVNQGQIIEGSTYQNPALSMTIRLPGKWHLIGKATHPGLQSDSNPPQSKCSGPFCAGLAIDVAMETDSKPGTHPQDAIFLGAYKLSGEYLDRHKFPLKSFAQSMVARNLGNNWVRDGELVYFKLGGKPAYRLDIHSSRDSHATGFAYVSETGGYVFFLLGIAISSPENLKAAIEDLTFMKNQN
jgi:hypothetical protein